MMSVQGGTLQVENIQCSSRVDKVAELHECVVGDVAEVEGFAFALQEFCGVIQGE